MDEETDYRTLVVQDGARRHYVVPRAIEQAGLLESVYTDWYSAPWSFGRIAARIVKLSKPALGKRMLSRFAPSLPYHKIHPAYSVTLKSQFTRRPGLTPAGHHRQQSELLTERILARNDLDGIQAVVGFMRDLTPSLCLAARKRGIAVIADQIIAPAAVERKEVLGQYHPGESPEQELLNNLDTYEAWENETWPLVDHLTCMSEYVRDGLSEVGIPGGMLSVLPYPFDPTQVEFVDRSQKPNRTTLTIGFVGTVCARKGVRYFFEVARRLESKPVRFQMVGGIKVSDRVMASRPGNIELTGPVPRTSVARHLSNFDIFYFPSCCEGSAGSVVEAMASGLPVVTSRNSGTYARDQIEGCIVPHDDIEQTVAAILSLLENPQKRLDMGTAARKRVEHYNIDSYSEELGRLIRQCCRHSRTAHEH